MYLCGLRTGGLVHFNGTTLALSAELPAGTHNAQPFRSGVLFNDSDSDRLRYAGRGGASADRAMAVPSYPPRDLENAEFDDGHIARQGFARGLPVVSHSVIAGGTSPTTGVGYDLAGSDGAASNPCRHCRVAGKRSRLARDGSRAVDQDPVRSCDGSVRRCPLVPLSRLRRAF